MLLRFFQTLIFVLTVSVLIAAEVPSNIPVEFISGSKTNRSSGIYESSQPSENTPGSREEAASWKDDDGNLWLFGGYGVDSAGEIGYLGDLWKFNPQTRIWTWISGSKLKNPFGVYAGLSSSPGGRSNAATWVDLDGNFWLFGGNGVDSESRAGDLNDLWKYDVTNNKWAFVTGSDKIYGVGVYEGDEPLVPSSRYNAMEWADSNGDFWLFGGNGQADVFGEWGHLNDLWKYTHSTGNWTWEGGEKAVGSIGNYDGPDYMPRARRGGAVWVADADHIYLYGGIYESATTFNEYILNDFWKLNMQTKEWTFISGNRSSSHRARYEEGNQYPGSRSDTIHWKDSAGDLWLAHGTGYDLIDFDYMDYYFENFWKYNIETNQWTWMRGHDQGIPLLPPDEPGATTGSSGWVDDAGDVWLFGGYGLSNDWDGLLNNFWKFGFSTPVDPQNGLSLTGNATATSVVLGQSTTLNYVVENKGETASEVSTFTLSIPQTLRVFNDVSISPTSAGSVKISAGSVVVSLASIPEGEAVNISLKVSPLVVGSVGVAGSLKSNGTNQNLTINIEGMSTGADDLTGEGMVSKVKVKTSKKGVSTQALVSISMKNLVANSVPETYAYVYVSDSADLRDLVGLSPAVTVKMRKLKNKEGKPLKTAVKKAKLKMDGDMSGKYVFIHLDGDNVVAETNEYNNYLSAGQIN